MGNKRELKFIPVSQAAKIYLGGTPSRAESSYWGGKINWAAAKDIASCNSRYIHETEETITQYGLDHSPAKLLPRNTIVITARGTVGALCMLGEEMSFNQTCYGLVANDGYDSGFLYYALKASLSEIDTLSYGTVFNTITTKTFDSLKVCSPPLPEQRAIAHILGSLDDKIEMNRRMNETLEAMARALFKSWFVDFDPVRAKRDGRNPNLPTDIAALFPDSFQDSELGKIPKGWRVSPVGNLVKVVGGSTPSTSEPCYWGGDIHFATPKDMAALTAPVLLNTERRITKTGLDCISSGLLPIGTVLLSSRAPIGYLAIADIQVAVNQGFIAMICDGELPNHYVLHWTKQNMDVIVGNANGTTFLEISKKNFRPILAVVPSHHVLEKFTTIVEPLHQQIADNIRESHTLAAIRNALLPKLLLGEVRIKEAKKFIGKFDVKEIDVPVVKIKPRRKSTEEFREAILISALVRALAITYPLGRRRYTKFSYLIYRKIDSDVRQKYLKKAAGPYNPNTKYGGPENIALKNGYVKIAKKGKYEGFVAGLSIANIDHYLDRYGFKDAIDWAIQHFIRRTNDDLGLLTTVDMAVLDLKDKGQPLTPNSIREFIKGEPEWMHKLNLSLFSEFNIRRALKELKGYFPETYINI